MEEKETKVIEDRISDTEYVEVPTGTEGTANLENNNIE